MSELRDVTQTLVSVRSAVVVNFLLPRPLACSLLADWTAWHAKTTNQRFSRELSNPLPKPTRAREYNDVWHILNIQVYSYRCGDCCEHVKWRRETVTTTNSHTNERMNISA